MATYITEPSHTFGEYLLLPGYSSTKCIPDNVCLKTPLVRYQRGESPAISLNYIKQNFGEQVKVGAGNVVDAKAFL